MWLRKTTPTPQHVCNLPQEAEDRDVWMCACGRIYIWSNASGYGFWWRRVWFRYWWFRAKSPA